MNDNVQFILFSLAIIILILITHFHMINNNNNNIDNNIDKTFLANFYKRLRENNNTVKENYNNDENEIFPLVKDDDDDDDDNNKKRLYNRDIYNAEDGTLILSAKGELRLYPNSDDIPTSCGFGKLHYNIKTKSWRCVCSAPDYFGGIYCDEPQNKLIVKNKCLKVGHINNLENTDVSTFNPILEGVCVECSTKDATPALSSPIPKCHCINKIDDDDDDPKNHDRCFSDPTNPNFNSEFNKYIEGYGCFCDYFNGFVEMTVGGDDLPNACLKIGKSPPPSSEQQQQHFHKSHLAYYTLKNLGKPIQIHEYRELEQPYSSLFGQSYSLLVNQPTRDVVHKNDWLNTCVKPRSDQKIRRLNYPKDDWPIVHKKHLVNHYERRNETFPISALRIATGRGFETKHWYETTDMRYMNNAVLGRPVMYGYNATDEKWNGHCTLNPLGPKYNEYYGLTTLYRPGSIVRMDTRGYKREDEKKQKNGSVITLPPNYETEMMDPKAKIYLPLLFNNYEVRK